MSRNWMQDIPDAQAYWIDKVLHVTQHDSGEMARFMADPDAYCRDMPLSPEAKRIIVEADIGRLYLAGANPYLLRAHALGLGIPEDKYLAALRSVAGQV